jgi:hypothetical protein
MLVLRRGCPHETSTERAASIPRSSASSPARNDRAGCCTSSPLAFALFESAGGSDGGFTQMGWEVDDIEVTVTDLRRRGVDFEELDLPGMKTVDGIAEISGNYPSKGKGERAAWFRDSEGNMHGVAQATR